LIWEKCIIPRLSDPGKVKKPIAALGLALDLTLRTLQEELKKNGLPWEKAKCFDGACPISDKIPFHEGIDLTDIGLRLYKNGQLTQSGNSKEMLFSVTELIRHATKYFSLNKGDIILTGTPAGVGKIMENDSLVSQLIVNDTIILEVKSEVRAQSIRLKSDE
jgi:2-keto-4-pentenoate hydratase/2-oxohepta-3-ene-1,7-dioic acid hydratase in catechol pathway